MIYIPKNKKGRNRPRRFNDNRNNKNAVWKDLAILGILPDMQMPVEQLRNTRDLAEIGMPGSTARGGLNGYVEIFSSMLVSVGIHPNDAQDMIRLMAGTGAALHWSEVPDFDPLSENTAEKASMKAAGGRFLEAYKSAQALRRKVSNQEARDDKKVAKFRSQFGSTF